MAKIYDISLPITPEMAVWPGDPKVTIRRVASLEKGDESNISQIRMSVHTGTHIDAPLHFIREGKSIGEVPLEQLVGEAVVLAVPDKVDVISREVLEGLPGLDALQTIKKVLFKTRNSRSGLVEAHEFNKDFVGLDSSGAQLLSGFDLDLVGVDYLSIASYHDTDRPHEILLEREVVLLEGLNLAEVPEGLYGLYCLPINLAGCEGAPARAILVAPGNE